MAKGVVIKYNPQTEKAIAVGKDMRQHVDRVAFTIVGHAIPHVGVDTGALINSLGHRLEENGGVVEAIIGSGAGAGTETIWYAAPHMAGKVDPTVTPPRDVRPRPRRPHPTKKAPTLPFSKAMDELGIPYRVMPGGFES